MTAATLTAPTLTAPVTLLGVWAHPDDESYLSAALMRRVVANGGRVVLVTATRGEHGSDDPELAGERLGRVRAGELRAAMGELGVDDVRLLDHRDGDCAAVDARDGARAVERIIREVEPQLVVTFGPDGITRHPDHVAVSRWTSLATMSTWRSPGALAQPAVLRYATMTDGFVARHRRAYGELPLTLAGEPASVPNSRVALRITPDADERRCKRAALSAHASQIGPLVGLLGEDRLHDWWVDETFRAPTALELSLVGHFGSTTSPRCLQAMGPELVHRGRQCDPRPRRPVVAARSLALAGSQQGSGLR